MFTRTTSRATDTKVAPWKVEFLLAESDLMACASLLPPSRLNPEGLVPRVWKPDPMVGSVLTELVGRWAAAGVPQKIIDLGCGSARDLCFLAERYPTAECIAVDRHPGGYERCRPLFAQHNVDDGRITMQQINLKHRELWPKLLLLDAQAITANTSKGGLTNGFCTLVPISLLEYSW